MSTSEQEMFSLDEENFTPPDEHHDAEPAPQTEEREYKDETLWTKYNAASGTGRRLRVSRWFEAGRVAIDISETDANTNKLKGNTAAFIKVVPLGAWLRAVANGTAPRIYPALRSGIATPENIMIYGGGYVDGQAVSRVFKAHYWPTKRDENGLPSSFDEGAFMWRTVLYKANTSNTGAFIPQETGTPLSTHSIKVTRAEMAEISFALENALANLAASMNRDEWLLSFSGNKPR